VVGHSQQRLVSHLQESLGIGEQHPPGGRQSDIFAGTVEELVSIVLFELPDLRAHRGLRAKYLLPAREKLPSLATSRKVVS